MFRIQRAASTLALVSAVTIPSPWAVAAPAAEPTSPAAAVLIDRQTVAQSRVVALGRDLVVRGRALSDIAAINGSIYLSGTVEGDVVAIGGDVFIEPGAIVDGDVLVLGGSITTSGEATLGGKSVAYPTASVSWLVLAEGPALGLSAWSSVVLGSKLALLAAWLVTALALVAGAAPGVGATASSVGREPLRNFAVGVVAVLSLVLSLLLFSGFVGAFVGVPLVVLIVVGALVLKLWGMVAVFCWLGGLRRPAALGSRAVLRNTLWGLALLGALKFLPWVGLWVWTAATLVGIGAALTTKFGRQEPWLEAP